MAEHDQMVEVFIYETRQFFEQLEQLALAGEEAGEFAGSDVNEIFRVMHTLKGSTAMMMLDEVSQLAHAVEDIFFYIRELHPEKVDVPGITDLVLSALDFMRVEIDVLDEGGKPSGVSTELREETHAFLREMKIANGHDPDVDLRKAKKPGAGTQAAAPAPKAVPQQYYIAPVRTQEAAAGPHVYEARLRFEPGCDMVEVRAYTVVSNLQGQATEAHWVPEKLLEDPEAASVLEAEGLRLAITTDKEQEEVKKLLDSVGYLQELELKELESTDKCSFWPREPGVPELVPDATPIVPQVEKSPGEPQLPQTRAAKQEAAALAKGRPSEPHESQVISVRVDKLDRLMDLVGELVIAESMVAQNPDLAGQELPNFQKAARQLQKLSSELQDSVMSLRMVPLDGTFKKMNRIVRDMTKKLGKKARLVLQGEETEVDKTINDHIGDPLMHIVRNAVDHGIEMLEKRLEAGKPESGTVTLSAANVGGEVVLQVKDDGGGLNRDKILARARDKHLFTKPEAELTDAEIYQFIFAPGFSTKEQVTEFSGRGVGMDVVVSNIKALGGSVTVDSRMGHGSTTTIRIPLTLAIIEGMNIEVGESRFTIPISSIRRSFRPGETEVFRDEEGKELLLEDGQCCPVVRLHEVYRIEGAEEDLTQGILVLLDTGQGETLAVHADRLTGVQEIVVKPVPLYLSKLMETTGISGCTLLGDGSISLILDAQQLGRRLLKAS